VINTISISAGKMSLAAIMGPRPLPQATAKIAGPAGESQVTDADWLTTYCEPTRSNIQDPTRFEEDALLYRHTRDVRAQLGKGGSKREAIELKRRGYHPFANMLLRLIFIEHPKEWFFCGDCGGRNVDHGECDMCHGAGYTLKCRDIPKASG
jgi:hypothetical protein